MKFKVLNQFEVIGVCKLVNDNLFHGEEGTENLLFDSIMGTSSDNLLNIDNTFVTVSPLGFEYVGGIGLTEGNDIVLNFWSEDAQESRTFWISYGDLIHQKNIIEHLKEII